MPTENDPKVPVTPLDPAKNNAEVARKVSEQDISGQSTVTGEFGDATEALDALAAKVVPKTEAAPPPPKPDTAAPKPDAGAAKPDAAPPDAGNEAHLKRAEELFKGSPSLPPNASPKSAEAFSSIKIKAAQEISAREQEVAELKKQIEQSKNPTPEQLQQQKELQDLREWRQKMDVDFDPKFKSHDKTVAEQRDFIYAQLAKSPAFTPEVIEQIKKYGGPDMVNLTKLFETAKDPTLQRLVEAKVADIEMAKYHKDQAIQAAKANVSEYLKTRETELTQTQTQAVQATRTNLEGLLGKLDWFAEKKAEASADETAKKTVEEHNKFLAETKAQLSTALQDDTPEMRAILLTGMAQLFHLQRGQAALEARATAAEKARDEAVARWEAVKNSSKSRLVESQAPSGGIPTQKFGPNVNDRPGDALDKIAQQVMAQKAAAAAGQ